MSLSTTMQRTVFNGNDTTGPFPFSFSYQSNSHIVVKLNSTVLAEGGQYTLSAGSVTTASPVPTGSKLVIERIVPLTQPTVLTNQGPFFAATHESVFDRLTQIDQQQQDQISRAFVIPSDDEGITTVLPNAAARANKIQGYDATGQPALYQSGAQPYLLDIGTPVGNHASLNAAIAFLGATPSTLVINTPCTMTAGITIPANVELLFLQGGSIANSEALTINGPILAGEFEIFTEAGVVTFAADVYAKTEWFGNDISKITHGKIWGTGTVTGNKTIGAGEILRVTPGAVFSGTVTNNGILEYQGDWSATIPFPANFVVRHSGAFYQSVSANKNQTPAAVSAYWMPLSHQLMAPRSGRSTVQYKDATSVYIRAPFVSMNGFRFFGQDYRVGRSYPMENNPASVSTGTDLGAEDTVAVENWYGVFAVANDGDQYATLKLMPFLRAGSVAGSVITLNKAGEGIHTVQAKTYDWATDSLAGVDCLVINETIGGVANNFSGRVTTVTANTGTTVTLETIGTVGAFDFILPAPPGYDDYVYLGAFYFDTAEVRNLADAGAEVQAYMIATQSPLWDATGQVGPGVKIVFGGYISPLATAALIYTTSTFATASTGTFVENFDSDGGNHITNVSYYEKTGSGTEAAVPKVHRQAFMFGQYTVYSNGGSLVASRSAGDLYIRGWVEP